MPVKKASLTVTGRTKQFTRIADSGNAVTGVFCGDCGVRIYHAPEPCRTCSPSNPALLMTQLAPTRLLHLDEECAGLGSCPNGVKALEGQT